MKSVLIIWKKKAQKKPTLYNRHRINKLQLTEKVYRTIKQVG